MVKYFKGKIMRAKMERLQSIWPMQALVLESCEELIVQGKVKVNGQVVTALELR